MACWDGGRDDTFWRTRDEVRSTPRSDEGVSRQMSLIHRAIVLAKKIVYLGRGEPFTLGSHRLRYVPGTRPVRLRYIDSPDEVVRNDAMQLRFFTENIVEGSLILDVGGHCGEYAVLFAALAGPGAEVVTFEPDTMAQPTLRRNIALNNFASRIRIEQLAVFDRDGEHVFFSRDANAQSSLMESGMGASARDAVVHSSTVRTVRLDDYLAERRCRAPALVKLDIEGAEINALRGAPRLLASDATIVCELHPYAWNAFGTSFGELLALVTAAKRQIRYLDPSRRIEDGAKYGAVVIS